MYFEYGKKEIDYLRSKDEQLGQAIGEIGHIQRYVDADLFSSVVRHIIGQQISTAAQQTVWQRMQNLLGNITAETVCQSDINQLQSTGITFRKAEYIMGFAQKVFNNDLEIASLHTQTDEEIITLLCSIKGIGVWTAEMIMIFGLQRPNIVSFGDLAIHRGMRMLYGLKEVDRKSFQEYREKYSPYGTVASLYLWAIAGGAISGLIDYGKAGWEKKKTG